MSGHGARCEDAGEALCEPRGLNRLGRSYGGDRHILSPHACGGPFPAY
jgi:hypothetical protein